MADTVGSNTVGWFVEAKVKDGRLDDFAALVDEMVAGTAAEAGTTNYEWYLSEDGTTIHIWEKYADSDAALSHVQGFIEKWSGRFGDCVEMTRFDVYGSPDERIKETVGSWGPRWMGHWRGFAR